mgnify:CR=1 FL=1
MFDAIIVRHPMGSRAINSVGAYIQRWLCTLYPTGTKHTIRRYAASVFGHAGDDSPFYLSALFTYTYPWGYPLLLFPCVALFGINYFAFKIVGVICLVGAFIFLYYHPILSKERFRMSVLLVLTLLTGNIFYWGYVNSVSSELPFFCFLMFSFWTMNKLYALKEQTEKRTILYIGLGILLFFTAQIRTEGYFLFISLIVLQWKNRLSGWRFFLPYASALCIWFVFTLVFPSGYTEHFEHFKVVTLTNLLHNIQTFYEYPAQIFSFGWIACSAYT